MMTTSPSTKTGQLNASIDADPFLFDMPEKDYFKISLDENPLPMPDELPPECDDDDFECIENRTAILEQLAAQKAARSEMAEHEPAISEATAQATGQATGQAHATSEKTALGAVTAATAHGAASSEKTTHGAAKVGADESDKPAISLLKQSAKPQKQERPKRAPGAVSPGSALRDACFRSVMFFPRKIFMVGHWAHDLKLGGFSGRSVIIALSVGCAIALIILMFAALMRSNSLRGIL